MNMGDLPQPEQGVLSHAVWTPLERGNSTCSVISVSDSANTRAPSELSPSKSGISAPTTLPTGMTPGPGQVLINVPAGVQAMQVHVATAPNNSGAVSTSSNKCCADSGIKRSSDETSGSEDQDNKRPKVEGESH